MGAGLHTWPALGSSFLMRQAFERDAQKPIGITGLSPSLRLRYRSLELQCDGRNGTRTAPSPASSIGSFRYGWVHRFRQRSRHRATVPASSFLLASRASERVPHCLAQLSHKSAFREDRFSRCSCPGKMQTKRERNQEWVLR